MTAAAPTVPARAPWHGGWALIGLALLLAVTGRPAQAADFKASSAELLANPEPITPIPPPPDDAPLKLALGQRLFEDPRLSQDNRRACLSCHDTRTNGAESKSRDKNGPEPRLNTTTVFNAALNFRLNWEGNYRSLEAHAESSLESPSMGTNAEMVVARLRLDPSIVRQFQAAYGHDPDRSSLLDAIATYERSLLTPGGRFDRWLGGDAAALTTEEKEGYRLFKSFGCISCHQGVNIGGNLYQRHGIFRPLAAPEPEIVRVPSLRNVATTPPYFHDGSAPTLNDAVRKMSIAQLNRTLADNELEAIVAFLQTLTGTYRGNPVTAPPQ